MDLLTALRRRKLRESSIAQTERSHSQHDHFTQLCTEIDGSVQETKVQYAPPSISRFPGYSVFE